MAGTGSAFEGISAALDVAGGIASYFASAYSVSIASSQASMIRTTAQANEARYALQAKALEATQSTDYAASGVKGTGSPIDVIDQTEQIARQNEAQILLAGNEQAQGVLNQGAQAATQGRMALLSGVLSGGASVAQSANLSTTSPDSSPTPAGPTRTGTGSWGNDFAALYGAWGS